MTSYPPSTPQYHPAFPDRPIPNIAYGLPFPALTAQHIRDTLHASRAYILCSTSLSRNTSALSDLTAALSSAGISVVGTRTGFAPHTLWSQVVACAADAATKDPDVLITLGAGSLTDACKAISWMLANDLTTSEGLETLWSASPNYDSGKLKAPEIKHVAIPTSLSGGEYQSIAGVTRDDDEGRNEKLLFTPPPCNPAIVILDPALTITTPERVWLSSGVRAVDHCVETLCSLLSNEVGDREAEKGLRRLVPALLRTKAEWGDLQARFESMLGVVEAMSAVGSGVPLGASHAIGHQLGPLGVGHGETSCILLPAVCKYNARHHANIAQQQTTMKILLQDELVKKLLLEKFTGDDEKDTDLGDVLDAIFRELGMPRTLKEVGVGKERLDSLAENSLRDMWIKTNAVRIERKEQVMEILEMVVE